MNWLEFFKLFGILIEDFALNTYLLLIGTFAVALCFSVPQAWIMSKYRFFGSNWFSWLAALPLAIPSYIQTYTYHSMLGPYGTTHQLTGAYFEVNTIWHLMLFMGSVLSPYIYLTSRAAFLFQGKRMEEAAASLGISKLRAFFKLIIPTTWPAIFSGGLLVVMEVMNNYGAVSYFGIKTFSTEIIRLWNPLDLQPVLNVSLSLLILVLALVSAEQFLNRKKKFFEQGQQSAKEELKQKKGLKVLWLFLICFVPILIGFIIPVTQLTYWAVLEWDNVWNAEFITLVWNTCKTAGMTALVGICIALIVHFSEKIKPKAWNKSWNKLGSLGYAIPGAVIGVGMLIVLGYLMNWTGSSLTKNTGVLVFAYLVRFQSVAYNTLEAGYKKINPNFYQAAIALGRSKTVALIKVDAPLLKTSILSTFLLVFVDITKELPLTMMFQGFNFETLAIRSFVLMETDGAVYQSAIPALIIVIIGMVPVLWLNRLMKK